MKRPAQAKSVTCITMRRLGVNRQSIIKVWIAERLERGVSPA
jgi:hypothetical protein